MTAEEIIRLVARMRELQRRYFVAGELPFMREE